MARCGETWSEFHKVGLCWDACNDLALCLKWQQFKLISISFAFHEGELRVRGKIVLKNKLCRGIFHTKKPKWMAGYFLCCASWVVWALKLLPKTDRCLVISYFWKALESGIDFQAGFWKGRGLCCNCYKMRATLTPCHIAATFSLFTRAARGNDWVKQMEKICLREFWFLPTAVLLYTSMKSGNRPSQINHAGWRFLQTVLAELTRRGSGPRGEHHGGRGADGLMCSCLCPLMPSPISCMTESCDPNHRESHEACRKKLCFITTSCWPENECLKMRMVDHFTIYLKKIK